MAHISLREAERRYDVTRPTLSKALKSEKISGKRNDKGHWEVDTAELAQVYQPRESVSVNGTHDFTERHGNEDKRHTPETVKDNSAFQTELDALRTELAVAKALADERRRILDTMVKQITDETKLGTPTRRRWWSFFEKG